MFQIKLKNLIISSSAALFSFNTLAATSYFEARNDAMGGTGVASSHYGVAPLANPALLTKYAKNDDASILLPSIGVEARLSDSINNLTQKFKNLSSSSESGDESDAKATATSLREKLESVDGVGVNAQLGLSTVIAIPNNTLSFAFMMKTYGIISAKVNVSDDDIALLKKIEAGETDEEAKNLTLKSNISGTAAAISEIGISFAKKLETAGKTWSLGITPKLQRVDVLYGAYYLPNNSSSDSTYSSDYGYYSQNGFNADIGAYTDLYENWTVGLVVQNIIPRSIETKKVNGINDTLKIRPQATTGIAWNYKLLSLALDVDLTPTSGFASDSKRQFASVGSELDIYKWAQIRAGYRQNMISSKGNAFTAGIGLSPFDVIHLDITGMFGTDTSYGAVAQLKITF